MRGIPMANIPHEIQTPACGRRSRRPADQDDACAQHEYTWLHREAWPLLVREAGSQELTPGSLDSWMRLWGRLGAELYDRFWSGDEFVRTDMIALARTAGGWRGKIIAARLLNLVQKGAAGRMRANG